MSTERPYHFAHFLQVKKHSLWNLILCTFYDDLIHVYSPRAETDNPLETQSPSRVLKKHLKWKNWFPTQFFRITVYCNTSSAAFMYRSSINVITWSGETDSSMLDWHSTLVKKERSKSDPIYLCTSDILKRVIKIQAWSLADEQWLKAHKLLFYIGWG